MLDNKTIDVQNRKKVSKEFKEGDALLKDVGLAVTVFGGARIKRDTKYYNKAVELGEKLGKAGFSVITGGGPGIMQGINEGAFKVPEVNSVGLGIKLPFEASLNQYCTKEYTFKYFFVRKVMMVKYADAFVTFPGGIGSLEEATETLTLMQTNKTTKVKMYLVGVEYWIGLIDWMTDTMLAEGNINKSDLDNIVVTDDMDKIVSELTAKFI